MDILIFNCGSSSQGFKVYRISPDGTPVAVAWGKARNVATKTQAASVVEWHIRGEAGSRAADLSLHALAAREILALLEGHHVRVDAVGHRFVHGGDLFTQTARIDPAALAKLRRCLHFAPIHNPNSLSVIEVCRDLLPDVPQYAVFDTSFHSAHAPRGTNLCDPA